jgi:hypothetical protein
MRASTTVPALTALIFEGGHNPLVTDDASDWRQTGCKVTQVTFSCDIDGALIANIAWVGTGGAPWKLQSAGQLVLK